MTGGFFVSTKGRLARRLLFMGAAQQGCGEVTLYIATGWDHFA
jgi:hypothetical protein